jgi:NitT/TauT family transport system permease protein
MSYGFDSAMQTSAEPLQQLRPDKAPAPPPRPAAPSRPQPPARRHRRGSGWLRHVVRFCSVACAVLLWQYVSSHHVHFLLNFSNVPAPTKVGAVFWKMLDEKQFYVDIGVSLRRIAISYLLAAATGIFVGVLMGRFRLIDDLVSPHIEILRPIPAVAWIPLAITMLPTDESSILFITFLGAFFPIVLNTVAGVGQTPTVLVRAARSLGARDAAILWHVILPCALPSVATGLAVGMGVAWFSLLAGEIISGQYGIGYFTWNAYTLVQYPQIIIGMLIIGLLGTLSTQLVRLITQRSLRWQTKVGARS